MAEITTLSGLTGNVRPYKPGDWHHLFSDARLLRQPMHVWEAALAKRIWQETVSRGIYLFDEDAPPWSDDILIGDRADLLMQNRVLCSDGKQEIEHVECRGRTCTNKLDFIVNMATDMTRNVLTEEVRDYFLEQYGEKRSDGEPVNINVVPEETLDAIHSRHYRLATRLPESGLDVEWRLVTAKEERRINRFMAKIGVSDFSSTAARLTKLGDLPAGQFWSYLEGEMSEEDYLFLDGEIEAHGIGIDTEIEVECEDCGFRFAFDMSGGIVNFLFPNLRKRRRGSRASRSRKSTSSTASTS